MNRTHQSRLFRRVTLHLRATAFALVGLTVAVGGNLGLAAHYAPAGVTGAMQVAAGTGMPACPAPRA